MTTIHVCIGSGCHLKGAYDVIIKMRNLINEKKLDRKITVKEVFCLGECTNAVAVKVNDGRIQSLDEGKVESFLDNLIAENEL